MDARIVDLAVNFAQRMTAAYPAIVVDVILGSDDESLRVHALEGSADIGAFDGDAYGEWNQEQLASASDSDDSRVSDNRVFLG
jgi:hypothetical protein